MNVAGIVGPRYEDVRDAVASCGPGVAVAAFVDGSAVVDVWSEDLSADSLICTWSAVKPVVGTCLLLLVQRGQIELSDRVVSVWPELEDDRLLVRHVLAHSAGRITVPDVAMTDWHGSVAALAAMPADWAPGEVVCEHALTFGHLVGEIVRRVDGRSFGRFLADELAAPLGLDIVIGAGEDRLDRVADTVGLDRAWWAYCNAGPGRCGIARSVRGST